MSSISRSQGFAPALVVAGACLLAWFAVLGVRPLFNPDEGRYGGIPREMLASGDWVLPRLNGAVYLEKPPLQYWATAASLAAFGQNEFGVRFFCALMAAVGAGFAFLLGRRWRGLQYGAMAAAMTGSMLLYVVMGQLTTLDMALGAFLTIAIVAFCLAQLARDADPAANRNWMLACWAAMAAATLTKGLIGLVIPGAVLVLYTLLQRDWATWKHVHLGKGLVLYAALVVPWFVLVERAHPGAFDFLIVREHFQRYLTKMHDRYQPWWYFLAILAAGTLPWLPQSVRALATGWRAERPAGQFDVGRVLWVAAAFILLFFSMSDSKLAPYVVPMIPLLALLGAREDATGVRDLRLASALQIACGVLVVVGLVVLTQRPGKPQTAWMVETLRPWLVAVAVVLIAGGVTGWRTARSRPGFATGSVALAGFAAGLLLIVFGGAAVHSKWSGAPMVAQAGPLDPKAPFYTVDTFDWTLPFYYRRTLIPVVWRGELDYGLTFEPERGVPTMDEFRRRWIAGSAGYALMPDDKYEAFRAAGLPMRVLARNDKQTLVSRQ
jgi:4-amino-4-deoxy-L-arabinose transferase-like glycosyltransferase